MSDEINALFEAMLQLMEKQITFREEKTFVTDLEMEQYRRRLEEIMKSVDQLQSDSEKP